MDDGVASPLNSRGLSVISFFCGMDGGLGRNSLCNKQAFNCQTGIL